MKTLCLAVVFTAFPLFSAHHQDFELIRQQAIKNFEEHTLPEIKEIFSRMGNGAHRSGGYIGTIERAKKNFEQQLLILEQDYMFKSIDSYYLQMLALNPNNASLWTDLGTVYFNTGDYQNAIQCYTAAINIAPAASYFMFRAKAFAVLKFVDAAMADLKQAALLGDVNAQSLLRNLGL